LDGHPAEGTHQIRAHCVQTSVIRKHGEEIDDWADKVPNADRLLEISHENRVFANLVFDSASFRERHCDNQRNPCRRSYFGR
jgi:hypothetical protein